MFIHIHHDYQCSACKAMNMQEMVHRINQQIIRCRVCSHEYVWATITTSSTDSGSVIYQSEPTPKVIEF